jgi:hypothetical protein
VYLLLIFIVYYVRIEKNALKTHTYSSTHTVRYTHQDPTRLQPRTDTATHRPDTRYGTRRVASRRARHTHRNSYAAYSGVSQPHHTPRAAPLYASSTSTSPKGHTHGVRLLRRYEYDVRVRLVEGRRSTPQPHISHPCTVRSVSRPFASGLVPCTHSKLARRRCQPVRAPSTTQAGHDKTITPSTFVAHSENDRGILGKAVRRGHRGVDRDAGSDGRLLDGL